MALTDLTRISTSGIATGTSLSGAILHGDAHFRGTQVGVNSAIFDSSENELNFMDNVKLTFGDGRDLQLYHDNEVSRIRDQGTGILLIESDEIKLGAVASGNPMLIARQGLGVSMMYNGNTIFETTNHGAVVTGILTASSFSGPIGNTSGISTFYDLRVSNNLTVEGTTTTLDTNLIDVDRVEIGANSNTNTAIVGIQSGTADIVNLFDGTTEVLTVKDGGNVGVGVTNPLTKMDVNATNSSVRLRKASASNYCAFQLDRDASGTEGGYLGLAGGNTQYADTAVQHDLVLRSHSNLLFTSGGTTERLRIRNDGRVGIGSATPDRKLDVAGIVKIYGNSSGHGIRIDADSTGGTHETLLGTPSGDIRLQAGNASYSASQANILLKNTTKHIIINAENNGRVGIGTGDPKRSLHVNDTVGEGIAVNGATSGIQFGLLSMAGASYNAILSRVGTDDQYVTGTEAGDLCLAPEKEGAFILGLSPHLGAMNVGLRIDRLRNYEIYFSSRIKINTGSPASPSEKVRIKSDGNVSIGSTADALRRVDIVGNSLLVRPNTALYGSAAGNATAVNNSIIIRMPYGENAATTSNAGARFGIQFTGSNNTTDHTSLNWADDPLKSASIYGVSEDVAGYSRKVGMAFYTSELDAAQEERLRITNDGSVGIGINDPDSLLETVSSATNGINAHIGGLYSDGGQTAVRRIEFGVKNYRNSIQSQQGSGGNNFSSNNDLLLNPSGGKVGIGTNNPTDILDINSSQASAVSDVYIRNHANLGGAALNIWTQGTYSSPVYKAIIGCSDAGGNIRMGAHSNHNLLLLTNNTPRLTIDTAGNLKIETAGKGIDFGANTALSGASNVSQLLDHYEMGTYVPTWSGVAANPSTYRNGIDSGTNSNGLSYVRIGNQVTVTGSAFWSGASINNTRPYMSLPFPARIYSVSGTIGNYSLGVTSEVHYLNYDSTTSINFFVQTNSGGHGSFGDNSTGEMYFNITYMTY